MKQSFQNWLALAALGIAGVSGGTVGCGGSGGSGGGGGSGGAAPNACFDYTKFSGKTPTTTFRKDVLPIFRVSCGLSDSCHGPGMDGTINLPSNQPYLGPGVDGKDPSAADIKKILEGIVKVKAEVPNPKNGSTIAEPDGYKIVEPGDPAKSFLMLKVDAVYEENTGTSIFCDTTKCADPMVCGDSMPQGGPALAEADKTKIRLWIAQGAKDD